jgi:hypothetical protein
LLNPSASEPGAVDGRVCTDLDIIVDLNDPELLDFFLSAIDHFKAKAVRTDYCAAVDDYP